MQKLTEYMSFLSLNEWLLTAVGVVLLMSLISIKRQRKQQQDHSLIMQSLQRDLRALANAAVGVGGRVLEIERQQRKQPLEVVHSKPVVQKITPPPHTEYYGNSNQPYEQAIQMAQNGASVDDIINVCCLSKSEAELVAMMHRLDQAS